MFWLGALLFAVEIWIFRRLPLASWAFTSRKWRK